MEKVCFITGASRGLGLELSKEFFNRDYSLILAARSIDVLLDIKKKYFSNSQKVYCLELDLKNKYFYRKVSNFLEEKKLSPTILINNAAEHGPIGKFHNLDLEQWADAIQVDFISAACLCKIIIPYMIKNNFGRIINLSGGGATSCRENFTAYACAKTALVRFTEILAYELRNTNIKVNAVAPGIMNTSLIKEIVEKGPISCTEKEYLSAKKIIENGKDSSSRAIELILFLASEENKISGKIISALWDAYTEWGKHIYELENTDVYTLRRITSKDKGWNWGDK